jgi:hypothetical protein
MRLAIRIVRLLEGEQPLFVDYRDSRIVWNRDLNGGIAIGGSERLIHNGLAIGQLRLGGHDGQINALL